MEKHDRVWQCYVDQGDEYDEPIQRALAAMEQLPGLPEDFVVWDIKLKEPWGIRIAYSNAGGCQQLIEKILDRLADETEQCQPDPEIDPKKRLRICPVERLSRGDPI